MGSFRTFLIILWLALAAYTAVVISRHGLGLLPIFFGDVAKLGWPGQFNLDFLCFLVLSALWTAWRNGFSAIALLLALIAFFGGAGFLLPYLVFLTVQERGNMPRVLIGAPTREMSLSAEDERDGPSPSSNELCISRRGLAGFGQAAFGARQAKAAIINLADAAVTPRHCTRLSQYCHQDPVRMQDNKLGKVSANTGRSIISPEYRRRILPRTLPQ